MSDIPQVNYWDRAVGAKVLFGSFIHSAISRFALICGRDARGPSKSLVHAVKKQKETGIVSCLLLMRSGIENLRSEISGFQDLISVVCTHRVSSARCFGLAVLIAQHSLSRKLDLVAFLANAFDDDLLAFL